MRRKRNAYVPFLDGPLGGAGRGGPQAKGGVSGWTDALTISLSLYLSRTSNFLISHEILVVAKVYSPMNFELLRRWRGAILSPKSIHEHVRF